MANSKSKSATTKRVTKKGSPRGAKSSARATLNGASSDATKLAAMMRGIDLCMMTTHGTGGSLHTFPMSNNGKVDFAGEAWFFTGRKTRKVREIEADGKVSLSYIGGSKRDPAWIALRGKGTIVDDVDHKRRLWVKELEHWFERGPDDPNVVLIRVQAKRATWWRGEEQGEVAF